MEIPRQLIILGCVIALSWTTVSKAAEPPPQKPTPKPGTLAELATTRSLNRSGGADDTATILITNNNLDELGEGSALTVMTSTIADPGSFEPTDVSPKTRDKWRRTVLAQSAVIAKLEVRRDQANTEIDHLERGRLDGLALDRIAKAEAKLKAVEAEIKRAKAQLSSIVRSARKEGAQPGWFR